jgi:hypothetical protein
MIPSLRFRGLDFAGTRQFAPGALLSLDRANSNFIGPSLISNRIIDGFGSVSCFSGDDGAGMLVLSSPDIRPAGNGIAFP